MASITKTAHNKHLVRIRITGFPVISKQFDRLKDAQVFAKKTEADMLRGRFVDLRPAEQTTLRIIIGEYLLAETVLKRGAAEETLRLQKISRDGVADYALANLTAKAARDYRDRRLKQVSAATVIRELNLLAVVVKWAVRELAMSLPMNPFSSAYCPRPRQPAGRERRFVGDEETRLFAALAQCRNQNIPKAVRFLLLTACRRGEMLNLRWSNIDFDHSVVYLNAMETKTGKSRSVPLPPPAMVLLKSLERSGDQNTTVFGLTEESFDLGVRRAIQRAKIVDLRVHDLRHEAISRAAESGLFNLVELCAISGHGDTRMLARYTHILPNSLSKKMAEADYAVNH